MELCEIDLVTYCNRTGVPQEKYEAAQDYLRTLAIDPSANAPEPLGDVLDKDLIDKVKELALDAEICATLGYDRIERELISRASSDDWFDSEIQAGLTYLRALRADPSTSWPGNVCPHDAKLVEELARGYAIVQYA